MRTLYHFSLCPFSRKVRVFLKEKFLDYDLIVENFWERRQQFASINPSGQVPVLVENNYAICDSSVICEYLEETNHDDLELYGNSPHSRAEIRRILAWFDQKFYYEVTKPIINERIIRYCRNQGSPNSRYMRAAQNNLLYHIDYMEYLLARRKWLGGERFTVVDAAAASHISVLDYMHDMPWDRSKVLKSWYMLVKSRPSFQPLLRDRVLGFTPYKHYADLDF